MIICKNKRSLVLLVAGLLLMAAMVCLLPQRVQAATEYSVGDTFTITASIPSPQYGDYIELSITYVWYLERHATSPNAGVLSAVSQNGRFYTLKAEKIGSYYVTCKASLSYYYYDPILKTLRPAYEEKVVASHLITVAGDAHTVIFDPNGGTTPTSSQIVRYYGTYKELPMPVRDGYTFEGWFNSSGQHILITSTVAVDADHTLTARWLRNSTVTFDPNGGTVSTASKKVTNKSTYGTLPTPTRPGYAFLGWYTKPSGGNKITSGTIVSLSEDITLYAGWGKENISVTFSPEGGTVSVPALTVTQGKPYGTLPTAEKFPYPFDGWYTSPSGGTKVTEDTIVPHDTPHTLYARYLSIISGSYGTVTWQLDTDTNQLQIAGKGAISDSPWNSLGLPIQSVIIENGITSIGSNAFENCTTLESVLIPNSVTAIEKRAFASCNNLQSVLIPNSVTFIGKWAFYNCDSVKNLIIPDSVLSIEEYLCFSCDNLESITIPDSVTSIGDSAFASCHKLTDVTIPDSVVSIGNYAFEYCMNLSNVRLGNGLKTIGIRAFHFCFNLKSIVLPINLTYVPYDAFYDCKCTYYYAGSPEEWETLRNNSVYDGKTWPDNAIAEFNYSPKVIHVASVSLNRNSISIVKKKTFQLSAAISPENSNNPAITWSSSNPAVAAVSDSGLVTGVSSGTAVITVTTVDGGHTAKCKVKVEELSISGIITHSGSETDKITVELIPDDPNESVRSITVTGKPAEYLFEDVKPGHYTLRGSKTIKKETQTTQLTTTSNLSVDKTNIVKNIELIVSGDVNLDSSVDENDMLLLNQYFAGHSVSINAEAANVDLDGKVTRRDAMVLARHLAGWPGYKLPYKGN